MIRKTTPGHVAGFGKSTGVETSRTTNAARRDVTRSRTTSNERTKSTTTTTAHTSRRGNVSTKSKTEEKKVTDAGIKKEMKTVLAQSKSRLYEAGSKEKHVGTETHGVKLDAYYQGPSFKMDGDAKLTKKGFGVDIDVKLKIDANLLKGGASAEKTFNFKVNGEDVSVRVKLGADGQVGINGELKLKLHVGKDGVSVSAGAEGFAGAKGSLSGSLSVAVNGRESASGEIKVTAAAGAMAGAEFEAGLTHFKAKAYAAVGVGVGIEIAGTVNAGNLARSAPALALPFSQGW